MSESNTLTAIAVLHANGCVMYNSVFGYYRYLTVLMSESSTLTAKAVPHANGCVMYNSVSGSSSSSWSKNCTLESLAGNKQKSISEYKYQLEGLQPHNHYS